MHVKDNVLMGTTIKEMTNHGILGAERALGVLERSTLLSKLFTYYNGRLTVWI